MHIQNPNVSYRQIGLTLPLSFRFGVANLVSQISTSAQMLSRLSTKPRGWCLLHSGQPAFTQSLRVQGVVVITLAPPVPISQPQPNSRKAIQVSVVFERTEDHGVDHTEVRRSCAEL